MTAMAYSMTSYLGTAAPRRATTYTAPAPRAAAAPVAADACPKCQGSGRFISSAGRDCGECFACGGTGKIRAAAQKTAAVAVQSDALAEAFARAHESGLKRPRVTLGGMVISEAASTSANAGALYVKQDGAYLGKIMRGAFSPSRDCTPEQSAQLQDMVRDPAAAARAYGIRTGVCCMCGLTLTNAESISYGIGPICRERWGI
jgi:Family of unknown function (DUF6011)